MFWLKHCKWAPLYPLSKGDGVLPQPALLREGDLVWGWAAADGEKSRRLAKGSCVKPHQFATEMSFVTSVLQLYRKHQRFLVFCGTYKFSYGNLSSGSHSQAHQTFPDHYLISVSLFQTNGLFNCQNFSYWVWLPASVVTKQDLSL